MAIEANIIYTSPLHIGPILLVYIDCCVQRDARLVAPYLLDEGSVIQR